MKEMNFLTGNCWVLTYPSRDSFLGSDMFMDNYLWNPTLGTTKASKASSGRPSVISAISTNGENSGPETSSPWNSQEESTGSTMNSSPSTATMGSADLTVTLLWATNG